MVFHNNTFLAIAPLSKEKKKPKVMIYFVEKRHASLKNEMSFVLNPVQLQPPLVAGKMNLPRIGERWMRHKNLIGCRWNWGCLMQLGAGYISLPPYEETTTWPWPAPAPYWCWRWPRRSSFIWRPTKVTTTWAASSNLSSICPLTSFRVSSTCSPFRDKFIYPPEVFEFE